MRPNNNGDLGLYNFLVYRLLILDTERWARADLGLQADIPRVTVSHPPGGRGCHYFPPGLRLPSQPQSITAVWSVPSYTAW